MSSVDNRESGRAADAFFAAFERLKTGAPQRLPKGSAVTQNNVAREAGVDPSALRKSRFPNLIRQIQEWAADAGTQLPSTSARQKVLRQRSANRGLRERLDAVIVQRDQALSKLVEAEARIVELTLELSSAEARVASGKVVRMKK